MKYFLIISLMTIFTYSTAQTETYIPAGEVKSAETTKPVKPNSQFTSKKERVLKIEKQEPKPATRSVKSNKINTVCSADSGIQKMECLKNVLSSGNLDIQSENSYKRELEKREEQFEKRMSANFNKASKQEQSYFLEYLKSNKREVEYEKYLALLK